MSTYDTANSRPFLVGLHALLAAYQWHHQPFTPTYKVRGSPSRAYAVSPCHLVLTIMSSTQSATMSDLPNELLLDIASNLATSFSSLIRLKNEVEEKRGSYMRMIFSRATEAYLLASEIGQCSFVRGGMSFSPLSRSSLENRSHS